MTESDSPKRFYFSPKLKLNIKILQGKYGNECGIKKLYSEFQKGGGTSDGYRNK